MPISQLNMDVFVNMIIILQNYSEIQIFLYFAYYLTNNSNYDKKDFTHCFYSFW
jgi:hypothetical protein